MYNYHRRRNYNDNDNVHVCLFVCSRHFSTFLSNINLPEGFSFNFWRLSLEKISHDEKTKAGMTVSVIKPRDELVKEYQFRNDRLRVDQPWGHRVRVGRLPEVREL
jgi:hypothetical protein